MWAVGNKWTRNKGRLFAKNMMVDRSSIVEYTHEVHYLQAQC